MFIRSFTVIFIWLFLLLPLFGEWQERRFDWRKSRPVAPGILRAEWAFEKPRLLRIYALRVDLHTPGLRFHVTGKSPQHGQPMPGEPGFIIKTDRQTVKKFFLDLQKDFPMAAAVNTAPWAPWKKPWNHPHADRMGALIANGEIVDLPDGKRPSFIIDKKGGARMEVLAPESDTADIHSAVSGFGFVLMNGQARGRNQSLAPRTGFGLSRDRRYLCILVADGRQKEYSMGMTEWEVGSFLRYLGAETGINMDGGGSSTLVVLQDGKARMLNRQPKNSMRTVGASLGISVPLK